MKAPCTAINKKDNPDYREPARPSKKYGMKILTKVEYKKLGSSFDTRRDVMKKEVVF